MHKLVHMLFLSLALMLIPTVADAGQYQQKQQQQKWHRDGGGNHRPHYGRGYNNNHGYYRGHRRNYGYNYGRRPPYGYGYYDNNMSMGALNFYFGPFTPPGYGGYAFGNGYFMPPPPCYYNGECY